MYGTINLRRLRGLRFLVFVIIVGLLGAYVVSKRQEFLRGPVTKPTISVQPTLTIETMKSESDYFFDARIDRERSRSQELERLREVMASKAADAGTKREANTQFLAVSRDSARENEIENLVRAKGYEDALAFMGHGSAVIVIKAGEVSQVDIVRITEIVSQVAGVKQDTLRIVARQ